MYSFQNCCHGKINSKITIVKLEILFNYNQFQIGFQSRKMLDTSAIILTIIICISLLVDIATGYLMTSYIKSKPLGQQTFNDFVLNHFLWYGMYFSASQALVVILATFELTSQDFWIHLVVFANKYGHFSVHVSNLWIQIVRYMYLMYPSIIYDHDEQFLMLIIRILTIFTSVSTIVFEYSLSPPTYQSMDALFYLRNYALISKEYIAICLAYGFAVLTVTYLVKKKLAILDYKIHLNQEMDVAVSNKIELLMMFTFCIFFGIVVFLVSFFVTYSWHLFLICMMIVYVFCFNLAKLSFISKNRAVYLPFLLKK